MNGAAATLAADPPEATLIVVVEDESIVLAGYQMLFESWGYAVVAAPCEDDALAGLADAGRAPSMIIADYRLKHGKSGVEAIRAIQLAWGADIPGILVTGETGTDRLREAARSGVPILHKPVNGKQLRELVGAALEHRGGGR